MVNWQELVSTKRVRETVGTLRQSVFAEYERRRLTDTPFVIVSNNCWGSALYKAVGLGYVTPFVGLYMYPSCYVSALKTKFPDRLDIREFVPRSRYGGPPRTYPVGLLADGEEVHFLHYPSADAARSKWNRRLDRMKRALEGGGTRLALKMCDRDGGTPADFDAFHDLPYKTKLSLGVRPHRAANHVDAAFLGPRGEPHVIDGLRLYRRRYRYFDVAEWILSGSVRHTDWSRFFRYLS